MLWYSKSFDQVDNTRMVNYKNRRMYTFNDNEIESYDGEFVNQEVKYPTKTRDERHLPLFSGLPTILDDNHCIGVFRNYENSTIVKYNFKTNISDTLPKFRYRNVFIQKRCCSQ